MARPSFPSPPPSIDASWRTSGYDVAKPNWTSSGHAPSLGKGATLAELLEWYGKDIKELTPWGRTKEADLKRLASYEIAKKNVLRLSTADYIGHVEARRREGAGPATANNDLAAPGAAIRPCLAVRTHRPAVAGRCLARTPAASRHRQTQGAPAAGSGH